LPIVLEAAASASIRVVRLPIDASCKGIKAKILALLSNRALSRVKILGIRTADHFWGLAQSGNMNEINLLRALKGLGNGVNEIMCHPGFSTPDAEERYAWNYHWEDEAAAVMSPNVAAFIQEHSIRLANFRTAWA
jgi:chitin disaccharide deacetylase